MKITKYISFSLLAVIIIVMVAATVVEKQTGSGMQIYGSWWFASLWALLAVAALCCILRARMQKRPVLLLLHLALSVILLGAGITHIWGKQGVAHLRIDHPCLAMEIEDTSSSALGPQYERFPFELHLQSFEVVNYPGTQTPMDYVSVLQVVQKDHTPAAELRISMNNIGETYGYRFYQSAYDPDLLGTILAVSYDPWGIGVTYVGYGLLFLSMLLLLVLPNEGFRRSLKKLVVVAMLCCTFSSVSAAPTAAPKVLPDSLANKFCALYAYYDGRICPVQTIARNFTAKLYGKTTYKGYSAEQVFTGWILFPASWQEEPLKQRKGARYEDEQKAIVEMLFRGEFLRIYPYAADGGLYWYSQADNLPLEVNEKDWMFIKKSLDYVGELAVMKQYDQLSFTLDKIRKYQQEKAKVDGVSLLPSEVEFQAERIYNRMQYSRPLAMVLVTLGLLLFFLYLHYWLKGKRVPRSLGYGTNILMGICCVYQLLVLCLRSMVSGHLPLSNGYETMQFMAWVVMFLTLLLQRRFVLMMPFGYLLTGLTLLVSMMGESNPQITPLMPVLQSPLLSIHVCIIMLAYSLLAITFFNGVTALCIKDETKIEQLKQVSLTLLYPALFCMAAGIFIGAIWANVSWGRYWGWDPKEVWALITMLVYSFALHRVSLPWFSKPKFFHGFLVLAFLCVLMTYFGVNFLLGGMHSYASLN